eukprot:gene14250-33346_t
MTDVYDDIEAIMADPKVQLATNALSRADAAEVLPKREVSIGYTHSYSKKVPTEHKATNQKASGRCWMFAALNLARADVIKKYNLPDTFEFSQSWTLFWDKYERASWFMDTICGLEAEPLEGRLMQHILHNPLEDGGQWDMFVNLVRKHGIVPKSVYPESFSSSCTRRMNWILTHKLRGWAQELREAEPAARAAMKATFLKEYLQALVVSLGPPPKTFDWTFTDKDGEFKSFPGLTGQSFYADHVVANGFDFNDWISLIHDPRNEYHKAYSVAYLNNVAGVPG